MNIRKILKTLVRKFRVEKKLKIYCNQFYTIFTKLFKGKKLNEHIRIG